VLVPYDLALATGSITRHYLFEMIKKGLFLPAS